MVAVSEHRGRRRGPVWRPPCRETCPDCPITEIGIEAVTDVLRRSDGVDALRRALVGAIAGDSLAMLGWTEVACDMFGWDHI